MTIQEQIQNDLRIALKDRDTKKANALKIVIAELQREPQKDVPDDRVIKILNKLLKYEEELQYTAPSSADPFYIRVMESYLPLQATDEEIRAWILSNIDLGKFKNRMQAMKPIMVEFAGRADGNQIKAVLESI